MTPTRAKSRAVFIDRDGTIMHDADYCSDPKQVQIFEGTGAALSRLKKAGYKIIVITNQSGIGRGFFTEKQYRAVEAAVSRQLGDKNAANPRLEWFSKPHATMMSIFRVRF